jgi:hypothetical protein
MIRNIFLFGGVFMLLLSCMSTEKLLNDKSQERIYFGKTGGFTNIPMEYVLVGKGHLFKIERDNFVKVHKISGEQIKALDSLMTAVNFDQLKLNEPGNINW